MTIRGWQRSKITVAAGFTLIFFSQAAPCAEEGVPSLQHRIGLATGNGPGMVVVSGLTSEQSRDSGNLFSLRATYGYRVVQGLEVGGGFSYWNGPDDLSAVVPTLRLRPFVPVSESVEIGLTLDGGMMMWPHALREELTTGLFLSLGIDGTFWVSRSFGVECFVQVRGANGNGSAANGDGAAVNTSAGFYSLGGGIGLLARL
jgi:hypothetical protein